MGTSDTAANEKGVDLSLGNAGFGGSVAVGWEPNEKGVVDLDAGSVVDGLPPLGNAKVAAGLLGSDVVPNRLEDVAPNFNPLVSLFVGCEAEFEAANDPNLNVEVSDGLLSVIEAD